MKTLIVSCAAALLASCTPAKENPAMQASSTPPALYRIDALAAEGECLTVSLMPVTERGQKAFSGRICETGSVAMLRHAQSRSNHVAMLRGVREMDGEEPLILPVTVALSIAPSDDQGGHRLFFAPPRPALVRVRAEDGSIAAQLGVIADSGKGALLAMEDGIYVTDALDIPAKTAGRWLGFAP